MSSKQFSEEKDFKPIGFPSSKPILRPYDTASVGDEIRFTDLLDTIGSYTNHAGKFLVVNQTEDGVTVSTVVMDSDKHYEHVQSVASDTWDVNHKLDKYPSVQLFHSDGSLFIAPIKHIDSLGNDSKNDTRIILDEAITGKAIFN